MKIFSRIARLAALFTSLFVASASFAAEKITYIHTDAFGSPVAATDEQGNVVWRETYQPYGERVQNQPAAANNTRWYTGHPQDPETGLIYAGARYYDPAIGRFMAIDPAPFTEKNIHSFNRYAYGNNNSYRYIDPDGRCAMSVTGSAAGAQKRLSMIAWRAVGSLGRTFSTMPSSGWILLCQWVAQLDSWERARKLNAVWRTQ